MNYLILKKFGLDCKDWCAYSKWAGLEHCTKYYSLDKTFRKSMFCPKSDEDWKNCVNEDFKTDILTNIGYAKKIIHKYPDSEVVGIIKNPILKDFDISPDHTLMGYDILDASNNVSLLTNWGEKGSKENIQLNDFALVDDIKTVYEWAEKLRKDFATDPHACNCQVWAVFKVED